MTMNQANPITPVRDVLYEFSLAKTTPDAELLDEYVRRYPAYATVLTDFAVELIFDAALGEGDIALEPVEFAVSPTVSRAMSRFQNRLFAVGRSGAVAAKHISAQSTSVENPFTSLDRKGFRDLANRLHANTVFVAKLRDREIDSDTMTDGFRQCVADEAKAPLDLVAAHFAAHSEIRHGQFYKAEGKPIAAPKQSFQEALKTSGLTAEQQQYLMSL